MKILFATDGSEDAQAAARCLRRLPCPSTTQLEIVTVREELADREFDSEQIEILRAWNQEIEAATTKHLREAAEWFRPCGWSLTSKVLTGHPAESILAEAEAAGVDLIALGCRGLGAIRRFLLGSVSDSLLKHAPCSVLLGRAPKEPNNTPQKDSDQLPKVLLCHDGSESARAATKALIDLGIGPRCHVLVVRVVDPLHTYGLELVPGVAAIWQAKKERAARELDETVADVRQHAPSVEGVLLDRGRSVPDEINRIAESEAVHLVIVGHKGQSGITRFLLGSVAMRLAHSCNNSLLVVR